ncbi:hypothetical protein QT333_02150 [Escherichia coli]|nr:hypothetical protein [Escherichia coli]
MRAWKPNNESAGKIGRYLKTEDMGEMLQAILHAEYEQLVAIPTWGKGSITKLLAFRDRLREEIIAIQNGDIDYLALESVLSFQNGLKLPIEKLEAVLLEISNLTSIKAVK